MNPHPPYLKGRVSSTGAHFTETTNQYTTWKKSKVWLLLQGFLIREIKNGNKIWNSLLRLKTAFTGLVNDVIWQKLMNVISVTPFLWASHSSSWASKGWHTISCYMSLYLLSRSKIYTKLLQTWNKKKIYNSIEICTQSWNQYFTKEEIKVAYLYTV